MNWYLFIFGILLYILIIIFLREKKVWLIYYLFGAFGLSIILIFASMNLGVKDFMRTVVMKHTHYVLTKLNFENQIFGKDALLIKDPTGWSILVVGIECSGLLESSVISGLLIFYPPFSRTRKFFSILVGLCATYISNIARLLIIVFFINAFGKSVIYFSHAIVGRLFFFSTVLAVYWYLLTKPTLGDIRKILHKFKKRIEMYEIPLEAIEIRKKWENYVLRVEKFTKTLERINNKVFIDDTKSFHVYGNLLLEFKDYLKFYTDFISKYGKYISDTERKKVINNLDYCSTTFNSLYT